MAEYSATVVPTPDDMPYWARRIPATIRTRVAKIPNMAEHTKVGALLYPCEIVVQNRSGCDLAEFRLTYPSDTSYVPLRETSGTGAFACGAWTQNGPRSQCPPIRTVASVVCGSYPQRLQGLRR